MKKIVFLGNCQATRLCILYQEQFEAVTGDATGLVTSFVEAGPRELQYLADADVIVAQVTDADQKVTVDTVKTNAQIIEFPYVTGNFLWPFSGWAHIHNQSLPHLQDGPYGAQFGSRWLNGRIKAGAKPDDIVAEYMDLDMSKAVNLDRFYELSIDRARERDRKTGFRLADFIEKSLTDFRLFMTPDNLELALLRPLAVGVYEQLGISAGTANAMIDTLWRTPFPVADHPIHPSVARHFGLKFIGPDTRYRTYSGEQLTFREWVTRYVHFQWNDTLLEGAHRGSRIRRFDSEAQSVLDQIERGLAHSSGSAYGESCRSHLLKLKGDHAGALDATRRAAALDTTNPQLVATLMLYTLESGDPEEAERIGHHLTTAWPHYADGWNRLGIVLLRRGKQNEAIAAIEHAARIEPFNAELHRHLASVLNQAGQIERARQILAAAIALLPDRTDLFADLARLFLQSGDLDAALIAARRAVEMDAGNAARLSLLTEILTKRGDWVSASNVLRDAIAMSPNQASLYHARAQLLTQLGRSDEAAEALRHAVTLEPGNAYLRHQLAQTLIGLGAFPEAEVALVEALAADPANEALHAGLANVLTQQGRHDEAEASVRRAIRLNPQNMQLHRILAEALLSAGKLADAEAAYLAAIAVAPRNADLYGSLALIVNRLGRLDESLAIIGQANALEPQNPHLLAKLSFLLKEKGDFVTAISVAEAAIALAPHLGGLHATLADIRARAGDIRAALEALQIAIRLDPGNQHYKNQAERLSRLELEQLQPQAAA